MNDIFNKIRFVIKYRYKKIVNSIAFYPAILVLLFLILSVAGVIFDFSETGKNIKSQLSWLSLKDAETARSIVVVITGGILSLTVFSFSMVMIVLNQAASNMSNRVLNKLIGNKFQQVILGIYIGTIVFALFLLSTIREIDSGIHIPAISTYTLIIFAIIDLFLFIYFLHYITQSVKYEVIIKRIYSNTMSRMKADCIYKTKPADYKVQDLMYIIPSPVSGVYEGIYAKRLVSICDKQDCIVQIIYEPGTFILKDVPFMKTDRQLPQEAIKELQSCLYLNNDESIDGNYLYGFKQLAEIAIKALSPGINDPGTACLSLRALFDLLKYRLCFFPENVLKNEENIERVYLNEAGFETIFTASILPVWDYGKNDRIIQNEMANLLNQFVKKYPENIIIELLNEVKQVNTSI